MTRKRVLISALGLMALASGAPAMAQNNDPCPSVTTTAYVGPSQGVIHPTQSITVRVQAERAGSLLLTHIVLFKQMFDPTTAVMTEEGVSAPPPSPGGGWFQMSDTYEVLGPNNSPSGVVNATRDYVIVNQLGVGADAQGRYYTGGVRDNYQGGTGIWLPVPQGGGEFTPTSWVGPYIFTSN